MPNGSVWSVPVRVIAENRAQHYADEFGGNPVLAMAEDTLPLFEDNESEISDWARNNMDWCDVSAHSDFVADATECDFQEGWMNGEVKIV